MLYALAAAASLIGAHGYETAEDSAAAPAAPQSFLRPCNNSVAQSVYPYTYDYGAQFIVLKDFSPHGQQYCLTAAGSSPQLRLAVTPCDYRTNNASLWLIQPLWSGGGSTYRPLLDRELCMTTHNMPGTAVTLSKCLPMPPPQPGGYANTTQSWYFGPGGYDANFALAMSQPNGGGVRTPAMCVTMQLPR